MVARLGLLTVWLLAALGVGVYHLSAGEQKLKLDRANELLRDADTAGLRGDYTEAISLYDQAMASIPAERKEEHRKIRLEKAKAQMLASKLPEAHADLKILVDELTADATTDPKLLADARSTLGNAQYYTTWLMRLEGLGEEEWLPEIDAARQTYKLLVEQAPSAETKTQATEDLEAAIRLARMSLNDLQAMPLPKQCKGCCSCKSKRPGKKPSQKKEKNDVRSAGGAPPLDENGH
jgi:tetratricopeptide (TPR) repeat protein